MTILILLGICSVGWTAYEVGRMSRGRVRPTARAWDGSGRPLHIEVVD